MTPLSVENFLRIEYAAKIESKRLIPEDVGASTRRKGQHIKSALDRLYLMLVEQNPAVKAQHPRYIILTKIDPAESSMIDLSTVNEMLNARISEWEEGHDRWSQGDMDFPARSAGYRKRMSLKEALNIANNNIFNNILSDCSFGPLWGKARALENVERYLMEGYRPSSEASKS